MASGPITQTERDQVAALARGGAGRNDIARTLGRSPATITKIARQLDVTFDRATTEAATAARVADARARRAELMVDLLDDASRLRAQLWEEHEYVDHGGRDFDTARWTMPEPTAQDKKALMQAAATAIDRSLRLDEHDRDTGGSQARSLLGGLAAGLRAAYDQMASPDDGPDD